MQKLINQIVTLPLLMIIFTLTLVNQANAGEWQVQKMSGDVWVETDKPSKVALTQETKLKNGDKIRTGQRGRVLLKRNKETILISPNSVIGLPEKPAENGKTIILQQAGEILLDVEKKNVKHFEVSTPYLAAVVKGTQFRVTVDEKGSKVKVLRGKVEVSNLKTGQFVLVKPGQTALVDTKHKVNGKAFGLELKGNGTKEKIQQGKPKKQKVTPLKKKQRHQLKNKLQVAKQTIKTNRPVKNKIKKAHFQRMRISRAIGHVKLNIFKSTKGLSRSNRVARLSKRGKKKGKATFWSKTNGVNAKTISSSVTKNNKVASKNGNGNSGNGNGNGNGNN